MSHKQLLIHLKHFLKQHQVLLELLLKIILLFVFYFYLLNHWKYCILILIYHYIDLFLIHLLSNLYHIHLEVWFLMLVKILLFQFILLLFVVLYFQFEKEFESCFLKLIFVKLANLLEFLFHLIQVYKYLNLLLNQHFL